MSVFCSLETMVKCLIRIQTKVNVHLRMVNHCYRDVKVRVLSLGPRLLGKALGAFPLLPALPGGSSASGSRPGSEQSSGAVPQRLYGFSPPARQPGNKRDSFSHQMSRGVSRKFNICSTRSRFEQNIKNDWFISDINDGEENVPLNANV